MISDLRIAVWNCSGIRATAGSTSQKLDLFDSTFPNAGFEVAAFIETHHKDSADFPPLIQHYTATHTCIHSPTPPSHTHSGIVVLIHNTFSIIHTQEVIPGRLLNIKFASPGGGPQYNLSAFYGPS